MQWLTVVSAGLFVSAIALVVAGERGRRQAPVAMTTRPILVPTASVRQIMSAIVQPNAGVVYGAVGETETQDGVVKIAPKTDQEWRVVADSAAALVEAGNLLLLEERAVDNDEWITITREFMAAARTSLAAADAKDANAVFVAGGSLNETCDRCHVRYQRR